MNIDPILAGVLSAVCISVVNLFLKVRTNKSSSFQAVLFMNSFACLIISIFVVGTFSSITSFTSLVWLFLVGVLSFGYIYTFTKSIEIDMGRTALATPVNFVILNASSILILNEGDAFFSDPLIVSGFTFSLIGLSLLAFKYSKNKCSISINWFVYITLHIILVNISILVTKLLLSDISSWIVVFFNNFLGVIISGVIILFKKEKLNFSGRILVIDLFSGLFDVLGMLFYTLAITSDTPLSHIVSIRTPLLSFLTFIWMLIFYRKKDSLSIRRLIGGAFLLIGFFLTL